MVETKSDFRGLIERGTVDFGRKSDDYSEHRPGLPPSFYKRLENLISSHLGHSRWSWNDLHILDLGTGPGIVALELAARGSTVIGVDIAEGQIAASKKAAMAKRLDSRASFLVATAENTKQKENSFDLVIASQCWPWFDQALAMKEIKRVLKPGGIVVVAQFCYLPRRSQVAHDSEQLVLKINPTWGMAGFDGLYQSQVDQLVIQGGFELIEQFSYDHLQCFTHEAWKGRMRTCNGVGSSSLSEEMIKQFDQNLEKLLKEKYPNEPVGVWHRVWGVVASFPPSLGKEATAFQSRRSAL